MTVLWGKRVAGCQGVGTLLLGSVENEKTQVNRPSG